MRERFEEDIYQQEQQDFYSDKCPCCMSYLNEETEECENNFCESKIQIENDY